MSGGVPRASINATALSTRAEAVHRTGHGQGAAGQAEAITGVGLLTLTAAAPVAGERATAARASPPIVSMRAG
jgi:hypothetical protein